MRARSDAAIQLAEKALAQDGDHIGGHALLAVACLWAGYDDRWDREVRQLRQLTPRSDTDRLLMAYALMQLNPDDAERSARRRRPGSNVHQSDSLSVVIARLIAGADQQDAKLLDTAVRRSSSICSSCFTTTNLR